MIARSLGHQGGGKTKTSGKLTVCYRKSPFLMGKPETMKTAIFNSYDLITRGYCRHVQVSINGATH